MALTIIIIYGFALLFIFTYSMIQLHLVIHYIKSKESIKQSPENNYPFPIITIQLPVYNELYVVERLINSVAAFNYPKDKLEIQVLDDSTDETVQLVKDSIKKWNRLGIDIKQIRRKNRQGYKAGALQEGLLSVKGEFIAIFDADFLPHPDFLLNVIAEFTDSQIGVVQTKWTHLNKNYSMLTRLQAFGLDAHFSIEQQGRNNAGYFINFNGTAGVWRKSCIIDAGGWQSDTLTEDLDLSYRAQLKGWKFKYLENVESPAELPAEMNALKSQQFRWTKGAAETAKKNLGKVFKSDISFGQKIHATFHLMNSFVFVSIMITAILSVPILVIKNNSSQYTALFNIAAVLIFSFLSLSLFYWVSFKSQDKNILRRIGAFAINFPLFLSISMGLSLHNALAVLEGYIGKKTPFIRTPKFNIQKATDNWTDNIYRTHQISWLTIFEGLFFVYFIFGITLEFYYKDFGLFLFHFLLAAGFGIVFYYSIVHSRTKKVLKTI